MILKKGGGGKNMAPEENIYISCLQATVHVARGVVHKPLLCVQGRGLDGELCARAPLLVGTVVGARAPDEKARVPGDVRIPLRTQLGQIVDGGRQVVVHRVDGADLAQLLAIGHVLHFHLGRKLLVVVIVKSWVKELTWLLIGSLFSGSQSRARLDL